ncbi:hypothetical protein CCUS01_08735 [Colletotrichum cuscutae]|uniref:Methyltransferase domain-containing protein n=1 Tax=Colletotrichum cuscutae TaxID=1209917 RepID=A0AAI9ULD0_9PEZI|nr:hypothetical protein CCUS01_08735 [Colletotrichum cuscutae]
MLLFHKIVQVSLFLCSHAFGQNCRLLLTVDKLQHVILARPTLVIMAEVDHEINIGADEQALEDSRADIESIASSSTSLSGSILDYRFEMDGRTIDTKTGVLGDDLSATQPYIVATNVKFEIDDIDEEWTYTTPFDYIHSRFMSSSIADWRAYLTKCFNHIQPGGYLELQEPEMEFQSDDGTFPADYPLAKYGNLLKEAAAIFGREYVSVSSLKTLMVEVGFKDVTLSRYKWPLNTWPKDPSFKELGAWGFENSNAGLEAISIAPLTRAHKWTREEVFCCWSEARIEMKSRENEHKF